MGSSSPPAPTEYVPARSPAPGAALRSVPDQPCVTRKTRRTAAVKSAVETLNPTRVKLTVEVPFEELKPSLDAAYKKIAQQINIPGFRKGKVPAMVIDQRVGREAVIGEAVNEALPQLYFQALQENNIVPLSQPELEVEEVEDGHDLKFVAELDTKPEITLPAYDGIEVEVEDVTVDDDA